MTPPFFVWATIRPARPVTSTPPLTVANFTSAPAGTLTRYSTCTPPFMKEKPDVRATFVSTRMRPPLTSSAMVTRSSAALAASDEAPRAFLVASTSTVLPVDGSTSILPLTLLISTRPFGSSW